MGSDIMVGLTLSYKNCYFAETFQEHDAMGLDIRVGLLCPIKIVTLLIPSRNMMLWVRIW